MSGPRAIVLNAGSSSLKFGLFEGDARIAGGTIDRIASGSANQSLGAALERLEPHGGLTGVVAVGHRIVHGGSDFVRTTRLDPDALEKLHRLEPLDPDHLPAELAIVQAVRARAPRVAAGRLLRHGVPPPRCPASRVARHPAPLRGRAECVATGSTACRTQFPLEELARVGGASAARGRVVMAHLGSGSSLAAMRDGACVDTTMSFTPNSGVPMATRSGDLDAGVLVYLLRTRGSRRRRARPAAEPGVGPARRVGRERRHAQTCWRAGTATRRCADAVALYCPAMRKAIGALAASSRGVDTLVFAGGIGENSRRRARPGLHAAWGTWA